MLLFIVAMAARRPVWFVVIEVWIRSAPELHECQQAARIGPTVCYSKCGLSPTTNSFTMSEQWLNGGVPALQPGDRGSIPGRVMPKTVKNGTHSFAAWHSASRVGFGGEAL